MTRRGVPSYQSWDVILIYGEDLLEPLLVKPGPGRLGLAKHILVMRRYLYLSCPVGPKFCPRSAPDLLSRPGGCQTRAGNWSAVRTRLRQVGIMEQSIEVSPGEIANVIDTVLFTAVGH